MARTSVVGVGVVTVLGVLLMAPAARAQQASGIAGVVRDTSGAVLPGVTVTAASPALIEKARTVFTDGEGRYTVVDLRPGSYTVTFTLPGFATVLREGIVLTTGFTATVNADLRVGAVEETVTVSGAAPVVDTQTVRQQKVLSTEALASLPTGNAGMQTLVAVTAGFGGAGADVGGTRLTWISQGAYTFYHGKPGTRASYDGMRNQYFTGGATGVGYVVNSDTVAEFQMETSGMSAEAAGGTTSLNAIPKDGSNTFAYMVNGKISTSGMQGDNLSDDLRKRGLTTAQQVQKIYRAGATVGGPIMRDKLWFFGAVGRWGSKVRQGGAFYNKRQGTVFYEPDLDRPAHSLDWYRTHGGRLTWQATPRNKFAFFGDLQKDCVCTAVTTFVNAIEAAPGWDNSPTGIVQGTWSAPLTSRLLLEAGESWQVFHWENFAQAGVTRDHISILEQSTNFRYGSPPDLTSPVARTGRAMQRFSVSYVTGSHTFKTGLTNEQAFDDQARERYGPDGVRYTFLRGAPILLDMFAMPYLEHTRMKGEVGIYAQDQWAIKRLTLNLGLRYDYITFNIPEQSLPAGPFVPARHTDAIYKIPEWKDWNPRLGVSYDLFGTGRTAVKVSIGRFVDLSGASLTQAINPLRASVRETTRAWTDLNGNYVPDCDLRNFAQQPECGPIDNQNFGLFNPNATRFADDLIHANRKFTWDSTTEMQHELFPGLSVAVAYNRNWDRNFQVADNLAVGPENYSPYCVTAPTDARLPGGGGYQICGLYDVNPDKFGQSTSLQTIDSTFGKQLRRWNGVSVTVDGRFGRGLRLGAGLDTGQQLTDNCFVIDAPGASNVASASLATSPQLATTVDGQQVCRIITPSRGLLQFKLNGSYPLPRDFVVSAIYQNLPGPVILADYPASNAEITPSLHRVLAGRRASATVPLLVPQTEFETRFTQLDLRLTKNYRVGRYRLQGNLDLYNALNSNSILSLVTTFGSRWRRPLTILDARLLQLSGQVSF